MNEELVCGSVEAEEEDFEETCMEEQVAEALRQLPFVADVEVEPTPSDKEEKALVEDFCSRAAWVHKHHPQHGNHHPART